MEIWKDIKNFEGLYQVSNLGRVKRIGKMKNQYSEWINEHILKPGDNGKGYLFVNLSGKREYIHRLVAKAFIDNPLNKKTVNHKDGNKSNNVVDNLEWSTYQENNQHAYDVLGKSNKNNKGSRAVIQLDLNGNFIKEYPSMREAMRETNIKAIHQCCIGKKYRKTAGGYIWKYKD